MHSKLYNPKVSVHKHRTLSENQNIYHEILEISLCKSSKNILLSIGISNIDCDVDAIKRFPLKMNDSKADETSLRIYFRCYRQDKTLQ